MSTPKPRSIRLAVATVALAATASLVTAPPATAGGQQRDISIRGIEPRNDRFFILGRVQPSYERKVAVVQRKVGRNGRWRNWERFRTTRNSGYRQPVAELRSPGRVYYRVKVAGSGQFRTSFSGAIFIVTRRG